MTVTGKIPRLNASGTPMKTYVHNGMQTCNEVCLHCTHCSRFRHALTCVCRVPHQLYQEKRIKDQASKNKDVANFLCRLIKNAQASQEYELRASTGMGLGDFVQEKFFQAGSRLVLPIVTFKKVVKREFSRPSQLQAHRINAAIAFYLSNDGTSIKIPNILKVIVGST
jgi:hypothetical protein